MIRYIRQPLTKIGIVAAVIFAVIAYNNDYMQYRKRKCLVVGKSKTTETYKRPVRHYLTLRDESGIAFNLMVHQHTFDLSRIGDTHRPNIRNFDIRQTAGENIVYFFCQLISGILSFFCLAGGLVQRLTAFRSLFNP